MYTYLFIVMYIKFKLHSIVCSDYIDRNLHASFCSEDSVHFHMNRANKNRSSLFVLRRSASSLHFESGVEIQGCSICSGRNFENHFPGDFKFSLGLNFSPDQKHDIIKAFARLFLVNQRWKWREAGIKVEVSDPSFVSFESLLVYLCLNKPD